ncbi:unnamed protein product [Agarophyton chilense]|eukprot:gb/GEZJ01001939.1/.p1 GENE.gb/GEZJ01001939.1/~~gb/GEZJ01001939.1/.p1  ORF type:complete len:646 (+),score=103.10 gb/GEZJ01001939.1/:768-2705(+)
MTQHSAEAPSFSVLLNPIRDLAANWSIDVANELSKYAASLGIDLDGTSPQRLENTVPVDFAQAALLVQGSTSIYSRKVEHLYSLVYTAVSSLNQLKSNEKFARDDADGADVQSEDEFLVDQVNFLSLDDCLPEVDENQITLPQKNLPPISSLEDKTCLKQIPPMLVRHGSDAAELASAKFNMLSARSHPSGALFMPGCPPFDENLQALPEGCLLPQIEQPNETSSLHDQHNTQPTAIDFDDDGFCTPPPTAAIYDEDEVLVAVASSAKKRRNRAFSPVDRDYLDPPKRNPFLLLDPHQKIPKLDKELRVGKTYQKPRKTTAPKPYLGFLDDGMSKMELVDALLGPISRGTSIRKYLCFEGARDSYQDILRRRMTKKRLRMRSGSPTAVIFDENREMFECMEEDEDLIGMGVNTVTFDIGENDDMNGPPCPDINDEGDGGMDGLDSMEAMGVIDGIDAAASDMLQLGGGSGSPSVYQDQLRRLASSYEETCRKYMERTRGLWEQHSVDAKVAKRVESWEARIQPILDEEEQRPEFDIAAYGHRILSQFRERADKQQTKEMSMSIMFRGPDTYDVCRKFLATLQLANSYSIEIVPPSQCCVSDPTLRLIEQAGGGATPVKSRPKRVRQAGGTPLNAKRPPLRQRLDL